MKSLRNVILLASFGTFLVGWMALNAGASLYKTNIIEKALYLAKNKGVQVQSRTPMLPSELRLFKQKRNQRALPFLVGLSFGLFAFILLQLLRTKKVKQRVAQELNFRDELFEKFSSNFDDLSQAQTLS